VRARPTALLFTALIRLAALAALTALAALAALAALTACASSTKDGQKEPTLDQATMREQTLSEMHDVVAATGMSFTRLLYSPDNYYDQGTNPFRAGVAGNFADSTPVQSKAQIAVWVTDLEGHGWTIDRAALTHASTVLAKGSQLQIFLTPQLVPTDVTKNTAGTFELHGVIANLAGVTDISNLPLPENILALFSTAAISATGATPTSS
jgi:hypothetical protein